jgi:methionyl-tRNA formyltransferase
LNSDVVSSVALNLLLPALARHDVTVALSARVGRAKSEEPAARLELRVAEQLLANDVVFPLIEKAAQPDTARYLTFRELERLRGIPVVDVTNPNAGDGLAFVQGFAPDLIISIRYGGIFKSPAIAVPRLGILNLHAGVLPAYRGVIATFRAIMAGEREIGCTFHYISDGTIDTGAIVDQVRVPLQPERSLFRNVVALYPAAIPLVARAIEKLACGETLATRPQSGGAYYSYPSAAEWAEFLRRGWRVADAEDLRDVFARYLPGGAARPTA